MMFNKIKSMINLVFGLIAACYIGGYYFFCGGIRDILSNTTIVDNTLTVSNFYLIIGSLKLVVANSVFIFILYAAIGLSIRMWNGEQT